MTWLYGKPITHSFQDGIMAGMKKANKRRKKVCAMGVVLDFLLIYLLLFFSFAVTKV